MWCGGVRTGVPVGRLGARKQCLHCGAWLAFKGERVVQNNGSNRCGELLEVG